MKIIRYISILGLLGMTLYSCKDDFLNVKNVEADISTEKLYSTYTYVQDVLWNTYSFLPDGFARLDLEGATDNAETTNGNSRTQVFNYGGWNQFQNPDDVWTDNFKGIRQANLFLKNKGKIDIAYIKNGVIGTDSTVYFNARNNVKFMEGEILFLKAFFYLELVKRYGGVPIFEEALEYPDERTWRDVKRNSLDECLKYIVSLCDRSAAIIPKNLSDFSWYEKGRVTYGAIKALKSRTLLYAASPLYREAGSVATWADAAEAANEVIALGQYQLASSYSSLFGSSNVTSEEYIFERRYGATNSIEFANFPIVFDKSNGLSIGPSQNLVDDFEVLQKDGSGIVTGSVPFDWNNPLHTANPYVNRDPRLAATVVYNGASFKSTTIETFSGGNSGLPKQNATKTGYYLSKWVNQGVDLLNSTTANHAWCYFRYGETLLNYAEAMFNAYGADADPKGYGLTAIAAINQVRTRAGMPVLTSGQLNQQRIERERNVELSFEDQRAWDVRRWKKGLTYFNVPLRRIEIVKNGAAFSYAVKPLESRVFEEKMNWYPITQNEISKTGWTQNPGW